MSASERDTRDLLRRLLEAAPLDELRRRLAPRPHDAASRPRPVPGATLLTPEAIDRRWRLFPRELASSTRPLLDGAPPPPPATYARNIENYIGQVTLPVGLAGPLRVNGIFAQGDYYVPLATTEGALVASCHRGALALTDSGGCTALLLAEGVSRSPAFIFDSLAQAGEFVAWVVPQLDHLHAAAATTTRHGRLTGVRFSVEGCHVYLILDFLTGDAAGQNMVTLATQAAVDWILARTPVQPRAHYVEANLSGDKKASAQSFQSVRGKKVSAEVLLPRSVITRRLGTTAAAMGDYWRVSALGSVLSGTIGVQGHYANPLAALFLATGQDAACVSEAAVGVTRFEPRGDGDLYASVTLPNLIVGTVGGGTGLPAQQACLHLLGLAGSGHARALAEVAAGITLAAEVSIIAALAAGHFTRAHSRRARGRDATPQAGDPETTARGEAADDDGS